MCLGKLYLEVLGGWNWRLTGIWQSWLHKWSYFLVDLIVVMLGCLMGLDLSWTRTVHVIYVSRAGSLVLYVKVCVSGYLPRIADSSIRGGRRAGWCLSGGIVYDIYKCTLVDSQCYWWSRIVFGFTSYIHVDCKTVESRTVFTVVGCGGTRHHKM
jgi:hypothetical protein